MTKIGGKGGHVVGKTCVGIVAKVCHRTLFAQTNTHAFRTLLCYMCYIGGGGGLDPTFLSIGGA